MGMFNINKPSGGAQEIYLYMSSVAEDFFDLRKISSKVPLSMGYHPDMDESELLNDVGVSLHQSCMRILRWLVELRRIDIAFQALLMTQFKTLPWYQHIVVFGHIFAYLKNHSRSRILFDPTSPEFAYKSFVNPDWSELYSEPEEAILYNAPEVRGLSVTLNLFVTPAIWPTQ